MFRIGIAEDDPSFQKTISEYIERYKKETNIDIQASFFKMEMNWYLNTNPYMMFFYWTLKCQNEWYGCCQRNPKRDQRVLIIFITNMAQYAINGYEVGALDFVLKPIKYFSFSMKLEKALKSVKGQESVNILLEYKDGMKKVSSDEIVYVEIRDHWLHIFTVDEEYQLLSTLKEFAAKLADYHFICCSSSFCINMKYVTDFQKDIITLNDKTELKVSRSKKKEVKQALLDYYKGGLR